MSNYEPQMNTDKHGFGFEKLVVLFAQTQNELQKQAARSVDIALVIRNWLFGWYIVEFENGGAERAELYGKKLLQRLSAELKQAGLKGVSLTNLKQFRMFYETYKEIGQAVPDQSSIDTINWEKITQTMSAQSLNADTQKIRQAAPDQSQETRAYLQEIMAKLSARFVLGWTHYVTLLTVKNSEERRFYEIEAAENGWGYRELERQITSALYDRLALSRDKEELKRLSTHGQLIEKPADVIKNPYILEFTGLEERKAFSEHDLETALIDKIEHFLLELGKGFLFESRQKRFSFENRHFYVDLVFYNRLLRCYTIIDLKIGDLKHQDLGQMQMYVNYFDRFVKLDEENPTVGILLCLSKNDELVELTLPKDSNIYASEYQLYLPSKEELKKQLEEAQREWEVRRDMEIPDTD
ncbi:MAG: PDDEXK nuclease domain-containing protein [Candidatus Loosdrechtia sp.]|uniref:PDDEXK nuclease domain-containing protein n=1 Tax=Candidatus Loosdrechtia sp. TaxID=3101272 RepID=UPI003A7698A2|nr:MAG: PDDEXK nuclease domain-containing protein [Candidatus Jettenia sp. AMX2]